MSGTAGICARLRRRADEYRALGEEHCAPGDPAVAIYVACEVALRELADALERADDEAREKAEWAVDQWEKQTDTAEFYCLRAARLEAQLAELLAWASRMPDAGLSSTSPRYDWWYEGTVVRESARAVLAASAETPETTRTPPAVTGEDPEAARETVT